MTDPSTQWTPVNVIGGRLPERAPPHRADLDRRHVRGLLARRHPPVRGTPELFGHAARLQHHAAGFCYAFVGHPELGSNTSLVVSYFKPDSPENANVGHVDLASVPVTAP